MVNGKSYIGFDSAWPKRKDKHLKSRGFSGALAVQKAIKKYGRDAFLWEVIYQSLDGIHTKNIMEGYFISEYDSFFSGYNRTLGGEGCLGYKHSDERKKKIAASKINWRPTAELNENNRIKHLGKKASIETKKKMSESQRSSWTEERRLRYRETIEARRADPTFSYKPRKKASMETRKKLSESVKHAWMKRKERSISYGQ